MMRLIRLCSGVELCKRAHYSGERSRLNSTDAGAVSCPLPSVSRDRPVCLTLAVTICPMLAGNCEPQHMPLLSGERDLPDR